MTFSERLHQRIRKTNSRVCLGIDPRPVSHPLTHPERFEGDPAQVAKAIVFYFQAIIETTEDVVACYKLQSAFFEVLGVPGLISMAQLVADIKARDIPVIIDAKRGDIGSTAEAYAASYLSDSVFGGDALTVNPYLGMDSLDPFVQQALDEDRGIFVLVKTSNPGSADFQSLITRDGRLLYEHIAEELAELATDIQASDGYSPIGAVVGANHSKEIIENLRDLMPHSIFLLPGYGAQGGEADTVVTAFDSEGLGAVVSSSRGLTYVSAEEDFAEESREASLEMRDAINEALEKHLNR